MRILISNDDGYNAPGIEALFAALQGLGELVVVAPEAANGFYFVNGTPSDCVHIALTGLLPDWRPDLVVSGINNGANLGEDTLYSGTVAAATEGYLCGLPAMAFSLVQKGWEHLDTAARVARELVERHQRQALDRHTLLNVNIPNVSYEDLRGLRVTRLGKRHPSEPVIQSETPYGDPVYWIGRMGKASDAGEDTDFGAVEAQCVAITPLKFDLTHHAQLAQVQAWAE